MAAVCPIDIDGQCFDGLDIVACLVCQPQHHVETLLAIETCVMTLPFIAISIYSATSPP